jgi:hypothetical protein
MYNDVAKNIDVFKIEYPNTVVPKPNTEDYENGFIRRYFIRQSNDVNGHIFEISNESYTLYLENPFWITEQVKWRISGPLEPVYKYNNFQLVFCSLFDIQKLDKHYQMLLG